MWPHSEVCKQTAIKERAGTPSQRREELQKGSRNDRIGSDGQGRGTCGEQDDSLSSLVVLD